jgi:hypothetical protein
MRIPPFGDLAAFFGEPAAFLPFFGEPAAFLPFFGEPAAFLPFFGEAAAFLPFLGDLLAFFAGDFFAALRDELLVVTIMALSTFFMFFDFLIY